MRLILIGLLTCVMAATPAGAILIRADRDDAEYLELASKYASAVSLGAAGGEGVLIAPRWVLTSAHRAKALEEMKPRPKLRIGKRDYGIVSVFIRAPWVRGGTNDVGLLLLDRAVSGVEPP